MRQEYLRAAAEAFANLTRIESDCYHYLIDGFDITIRDRLVNYYTNVLLAKSVPVKFIDKVVRTALADCQYPINTAIGFAWSGNQRAAFAGIPKATWSRNELCKQVNFIIDDMRSNAHATRLAIASQLLSS